MPRPRPARAPAAPALPPALPPAIAAAIAAARAHLARRPQPRAAAGAPSAFAAPPGALVCVVPLRTVNPLNRREDWRARSKRVQREHAVTLAALRQQLGMTPPALPLRITLARIGPRTMDSDGAVASGKSVRDSVAAWIGCDDRDTPRLVWAYGPQERGPFAVRVVIERLETTDAR